MPLLAAGDDGDAPIHGGTVTVREPSADLPGRRSVRFGRGVREDLRDHHRGGRPPRRGHGRRRRRLHLRPVAPADRRRPRPRHRPAAARRDPHRRRVPRRGAAAGRRDRATGPGCGPRSSTARRRRRTPRGCGSGSARSSRRSRPAPRPRPRSTTTAPTPSCIDSPRARARARCSTGRWPRARRSARRFILAGGLTPDNVGRGHRAGAARGASTWPPASRRRPATRTRSRCATSSATPGRPSPPATRATSDAPPYDWEEEPYRPVASVAAARDPVGADDRADVMGDPTPTGRFGRFGGRFVPETLVPACEELEAAFGEAWADPAFRAELDAPAARLRRPAVDPHRVPPARRRARVPGAAQARGPQPHRQPQDQQRARPGAAGPAHGQDAGSSPRPAPASTASPPPPPPPCSGMECVVYMGEVDMDRQALNVFRMRLLGAEVRPAAHRQPHAEGRRQRGHARLGGRRSSRPTTASAR